MEVGRWGFCNMWTGGHLDRWVSEHVGCLQQGGMWVGKQVGCFKMWVVGLVGFFQKLGRWLVGCLQQVGMLGGEQLGSWATELFFNRWVSGKLGSWVVWQKLAVGSMAAVL
jgi:hypothetical protein